MIKNINKAFEKSSLIIVLAFLAFQGFGQDTVKKVTLQIGDKAPALNYSKWIKGLPVDITGNKVYVIEFWATWCAPCIAAMPHLSELAEKYTNKVDFIGCSIDESKTSRDKSQPYESYLPKIEKFVNSDPNRMRYNVIADNNALDMINHWVHAAGQSGIPCTFVVQNNRIMWIGNPIKLDKILEDLVSGNFNLAATKQKVEADFAETKAKMQNERESDNAISAALAVKDYEKAFKLVDYYVQFPYLRAEMRSEKFDILLNYFSEEKAIKYAKEQNKESTECAFQFASTILSNSKVSSQAYEFAAECYNLTKANSAFVRDKVAEAHQKAGNIAGAIEAEQQALVIAKDEMKDPKREGKITMETIANFEAKLKKYKSQL